MIDEAHGVAIEPLMETARVAGTKILEVYGREFEVEHKGDDSPLTEADKAANEIIMAFLDSAYPAMPVISEENREIAYSERRDWRRFWLVDPLDGTKEFINRNDEFTVNIALVENGQPVLGVVYQPVNGTLYLGVENAGAWRIAESGGSRVIEAGPHYSEKNQVRVVASRSHLTPEVGAFVEELRGQGKEVEFLSAGSSLKLCLVAEGAADVYPRFGPTMEWDTGAAQVVATSAGRQVLDAATRKPLSYNKENLLNPHFIVE